MEVFYTDSFIPDYGIGEELLDGKNCLTGRIVCEDYLCRRFLFIFYSLYFPISFDLVYLLHIKKKLKVRLNVRVHLQHKNSRKSGLETR